MFWIKIKKLFKGEGISTELSIFLSWGKENVMVIKLKLLMKGNHSGNIVQSVCKTQKQTQKLCERKSNSAFEGFYLWDNVTKHKVNV